MLDDRLGEVLMAKEGGRFKEIVVGAVRFTALSLLLLGAQHLVGHTAPFESVKNFAYGLLQLRLASVSDPSEDVVIVDISGFPRTVRGDLSGEDAPTSRADLLRLLTRISDSGATAIGIDIDFSPEDDGNYVLPDDPEFFRSVQALSRSKRVPIFLGVWRQAARGPENWLADGQFAELSAGLPIPEEHTRRMPLFIQAGEGQQPLKTMATALASTEGKLREGPPSWLSGMLEYRLEVRPKPGLEIEEIAVDYSQLETLIRNRVDWRSIGGSTPNRLKGKLVLIGDASPVVAKGAEDSFQAPGRLGEFAGAYLHGSAAYSALKAPLYEFKEGAGERLDLIVGFISLCIAVGIQIGLRKDPEFHPKAARYASLATYSTALLLFIFGAWFVNVTRTMWDDFPIFIAALLIHHWSETLIEKRLEKSHVHAGAHTDPIVHLPEAPRSVPVPDDADPVEG